MAKKTTEKRDVPAPIRRALGREIKRLRTLKAHSQWTVANAIETDAASISRIERGTQVPSLGTLVALANQLGVKAHTLVAAAEDSDPGNRATTQLGQVARRKPGVAHTILARNVQALLDRRLQPEKRLAADAQAKIEEKRHVVESARRIIATGHADLDLIADIANAFNLHPYQLLIPDLNPERPQMAVAWEYAQPKRKAA